MSDDRRDYLRPDIEWGGPDVGSRQARLDAAYAEYEKRHTGADRGAHHRPSAPATDDDGPARWHEDDFTEGGRAWREMQLLDIEIVHRSRP